MIKNKLCEITNNKLKILFIKNTMRKNLSKLLLTTALSVVSVGMFAQYEVNPIPVAAPVLTIAPDARAGGMGDAGVATAPDVYSQHWNPSKYAFHTRGAGVAVSYTPWLRKIVDDVALMNVVGFWKPGNDDNQAISSSLTYFKIGDVNLTDIQDFYPGSTWSDAGSYNTISPYEMAFDVAYSRKLSNSFSMGVALRYIRVDYSGFSETSTSSDAISADIAGYLERYLRIGSSESLLTFGGNISNITGAKISTDGGTTNSFIPTNMRIGASLMYPVTDVSTFSFSLDLNKLLVPTPPMQPKDADKNSAEWDAYLEKKQKYFDKSPIAGIFSSFGDASFSEELKEIMWSFGVEYDYDSKFRVRSGYFYENKMKGNRQYFSFGAGFKFNMFQLDAAYMSSTRSNNPLDQTLRLSLAFDIPTGNRF